MLGLAHVQVVDLEKELEVVVDEMLSEATAQDTEAAEASEAAAAFAAREALLDQKTKSLIDLVSKGGAKAAKGGRGVRKPRNWNLPDTLPDKS